MPRRDSRSDEGDAADETPAPVVRDHGVTRADYHAHERRLDDIEERLKGLDHAALDKANAALRELDLKRELWKKKGLAWAERAAIAFGALLLHQLATRYAACSAAVEVPTESSSHAVAPASPKASSSAAR